MIGFGYDVHQLKEGESLVLGGVSFESEKGTVAHSDGDVLLHAIMDALLGSLALGDIGLHFPDTDPKFKNADSLDLLRRVGKLIAEKAAKIINIDSTIVLESPRLRGRIDEMRAKIAQTLSLSIDQVSIKATTSERLGFVGRSEGVQAYAVCQMEYNTT